MNTKKGQFEPAEVGKLIEKHFNLYFTTSTLKIIHFQKNNFYIMLQKATE
jgi:hypothetical protein